MEKKVTVVSEETLYSGDWLRIKSINTKFPDGTMHVKQFYTVKMNNNGYVGLGSIGEDNKGKSRG